MFCGSGLPPETFACLACLCSRPRNGGGLHVAVQRNLHRKASASQTLTIARTAKVLSSHSLLMNSCAQDSS